MKPPCSRYLLVGLAALLLGTVGCESLPKPAAGASTAAPSSVGPAPTSEAARAAFLKVHNDARAAVGVPPLQCSDELANYARSWADTLIARGGDLVHRPNNPHGENLAGGRYGSPTPKLAAELWLAEKKFYRDGPTGSQEGVGHYTAMIWRETTHVGYAMAQGPDGLWVVVANYSPAGNILGQHPVRR